MFHYAANYLDVADQSLNKNNPVILWNNLVTAAGVDSDTEQAMYPATNLANPSTISVWKGDAIALEAVRFTFDAQTVDCFGIYGHNAREAGCTVSFYYAPVGGVYQLVDTIPVPTDDSPIIFKMNPVETETVQVVFSAGTAKPQAAVIYVGEALVVQRRIYVGHTPITMGRATKVVTGRSESGAFLGRIIVGEGRMNSVALKNLDPDWYREKMDPFIEEAAESPFFFAWRPLSYPAEIGYAWLTNEPKPINSLANGMMQVDLEIAGVVI